MTTPQITTNSESTIKWPESNAASQTVNTNGTGYTGKRYKILDENSVSNVHEIAHEKIAEKKTIEKDPVVLNFDVKALGTSQDFLKISPENRNLFKKNVEEMISELNALVRDYNVSNTKEVVPALLQAIRTRGITFIPMNKEYKKEITFEEAEKALNRDCKIPESILDRLKALWPKFLNPSENDEDIDIISKGENFSAFQLPETNDFIFKTAPGFGNIQKRYKNTVLGNQAIMKHGLENQVTTPSVILLNDLSIMAENCVDVYAGNCFHGELKEQINNVEALAEEIVKFIDEAGNGNVGLNYFPIFNQDGDAPHLGVVNFERLDSQSENDELSFIVLVDES